MLQPSQERATFSFDDIVFQFWHQKVLNLVIAGVIIVLTILWLHWVDREYTARMVISPSVDSGSSSGGGLTRGIERYFRIGGVDLSGSGGADPHEHYLQLLHSSELAELLQANHKFLQRLYPTLWDPGSDTWIKPKGFTAGIKAFVKNALAMPEWSPPSEEYLANILKKRIEVKPIRNTSFTEIVGYHPNPKIALELLTLSHRNLDDMLRQKTKARVMGQIEYIKSKLETVRITEHRDALSELLIEQERKMMMISIGLPFAANLVERPFVASAPSFPNAKLSILVGLLFSLVLCVTVAVIRVFQRPAL